MVGIAILILAALWMPLGAMHSGSWMPHRTWDRCPKKPAKQVATVSLDQEVADLIQKIRQENDLLRCLADRLEEALDNGETLLKSSLVLHKLAGKPEDFFPHYNASKWSAIVERLIELGAPVDMVAPTTMTPLYHAVKNKHLWLIKVLLAHGADAKRYFINQHPVPGSLLHLAVRQYKVTDTDKDNEIIDLLLVAGLHPYVQDYGSYQAWQLTHDADLKSLLIAYGRETPFVERFPVCPRT